MLCCIWFFVVFFFVSLSFRSLFPVIRMIGCWFGLISIRNWRVLCVCVCVLCQNEKKKQDNMEFKTSINAMGRKQRHATQNIYNIVDVWCFWKTQTHTKKSRANDNEWRIEKTKPLIMIVVITFSLRVKNQLSTQVIGNFEVERKNKKESETNKKQRKRFEIYSKTLPHENGRGRDDVYRMRVTDWLDGWLTGRLAVCLPESLRRVFKCVCVCVGGMVIDFNTATF